VLVLYLCFVIVVINAFVVSIPVFFFGVGGEVGRGGFPALLILAFIYWSLSLSNSECGSKHRLLSFEILIGIAFA
jgi:hypothetical protein